MATKRQVFFSFQYDTDAWRASQVRNIGIVDGSAPVSDNAWEEVKRGGDPAIKRWIEEQLSYRSCTLVLAGSGTAGRKWINHEISRSWALKKGVAAIHIHNLKDSNGYTSHKGANPFSGLNLNGTPFDSIAPCYDPGGMTSQDTYRWIANNISAITETAIATRNNYP